MFLLLILLLDCIFSILSTDAVFLLFGKTKQIKHLYTMCKMTDTHLTMFSECKSHNKTHS